MINATKPYLPPQAAYQRYLDRIWETGWLTNNGELVHELERRLAETLGTDHLLLVNNGTIALQIAIKAMGLKGDIVTTPFSYVATTSSIVWEGCRPVFADIDPGTLCIDPEEIERRITPATTAILATHVFGIPCDVDAIRDIAGRHGLAVIYDAAHAFGVTVNGESVLRFGDASTLSFHATKLFHTVEGGGIYCHNPRWFGPMEYMRRFGHNGPYDFHGLGINGKVSEIHAAMGLCILPEIDNIIARRKEICDAYDARLDGLGLQRPTIPAGTGYNYAYYPVLFPDEATLLRVVSALEAHGVNGRRYFRPSLNKLNYVEPQTMPVSEDISARIFCLPLYHDLEDEAIALIGDTLRKALR